MLYPPTWICKLQGVPGFLSEFGGTSYRIQTIGQMPSKMIVGKSPIVAVSIRTAWTYIHLRVVLCLLCLFQVTRARADEPFRGPWNAPRISSNISTFV